MDYFHEGCKPPDDWRIGTELELCGVMSSGPDIGGPLPYHGERGIDALFESLIEGGCWKQVMDGNELAALACSGHQLTTEPGGQFEFSARPASSSSEFMTELAWYFKQLRRASDKLGLAWLQVGCRPYQELDEIPWMPKRRYVVMHDFLPARGSLAMEMMKRTCTVQVNLDFSDVDDAAAKLRASMAVTSILTAIWANSPIKAGQVTGYQSYRGHIWTDVDNQRCGLLPFAFEDGDVFRAYTEWALDVPMAFIYRDGYVNMEAMTFRQFMAEGYREHRATMDDWAILLTTLYPEVRLKRYMEVRGCDTGSVPMIPALGALTRGYLYDAEACRAATALTAGLDFSARNELREAAAKDGLRARVPGRSSLVGELAAELLDIAEAGLRRTAPHELPYLEPVRAIVHERRTQADDMLDLWASTAGDPAKFVPALSIDLGQLSS